MLPQPSALADETAGDEHDIPEFNRDPAQARIVTDDLERFWRAWDLGMADPDRRRSVFQRKYLDAGSPGLEAMLELRIGGVEQLLAAVDAHPEYYASLRPLMPRMRAVAEPVRDAMDKLHALLPEAVFPDTYLVIGAMNTGGTIHFDGVLIGAEMYGMTRDTPIGELGDWHRAVIGAPEDLLTIIVHEMIHFQQLELTRAAPPATLLGLSIYEGAGDFVTELLTGRNINEHVHEWAKPREKELWAEFRDIMHEREYGDWLYGGASVNDRPADLGYFIGYRIVESYYRQADDRQAAVFDILAMMEPERFLQDSGYEPLACPAK